MSFLWFFYTLGQLWHKDITESWIYIVWILRLLHHDSISGWRPEDLLCKQVSYVRQKRNNWHHDQAYPRLLTLHDHPILPIDLWLENLCGPRHTSQDYTKVVEKEAAAKIDQHCKPIPIGGLNEELEYDDVHDEGEGKTWRKPMWVSLSWAVNWTSHAIHSSIKGSDSVPECHHDPPPEDLDVEIDILLTCFIDLWVRVHILVVHILLESICGKTSPGGPNCIKHGLQ